MSELAFFRHGEELLRVQLGERTTIGRSADCDVSLPDPTLSRVQALVERRGEGFVLLDQSGRGTRVGGVEVSTAPLTSGSEIAFGTWRALFRTSAAALAEATAAGGATGVRATPPSTPAPARLRVREGGRERVAPLPADGLSVGSDPSNALVLEDPYVSARHLRIEPRAGRWEVVDVGSTNGTFLGGVRVWRSDLPPGLPLAIGDSELLLEVGTPREGRLPGSYEGMFSLDPSMRQVFDLVDRLAETDVPVAILGETGTGKELVARALHARSSRRDGPFIPVNCAAIPESLMESELFGHEKGAFSGADRQRKGAFEEADRGTLFLDEIGEMPLELQAKLLRALESGEVKRVGSSRPIQVSVHVVSATHRDLAAQVRAQRFREDLYYRLCVFPVAVPPLRRRQGDVRALAQRFLDAAAPRGQPLRWSEEALQKLEGYDWPGNVRQLRNVVLRALLLRGEGQVLPASVVTFEDVRPASGHGGDDTTLYLPGLTLEDIEREAIRLSLRRHRGKRAAVVRELRIAKSTVMKRIAQWGLQDEGRDGARPDDDEADDEP
ncbi:MAG TPA: sigma 54-interacting transcriptional regulator [Anaeromyxobacteraceae bacterium]|nr:sigma 54-interacting transcriptional regulator [Anaeromyxobacteraceae bacterium]